MLERNGYGRASNVFVSGYMTWRSLLQLRVFLEHIVTCLVIVKYIWFYVESPDPSLVKCLVKSLTLRGKLVSSMYRTFNNECSYKIRFHFT